MPHTTPAEVRDSALRFSFPAVRGKKVTAAFDGGRLTSDGGVLLLAQAERTMGICQRLAECIADPRDPSRVVHRVSADVKLTRVAGSKLAHLLPCPLGGSGGWMLTGEMTLEIRILHRQGLSIRAIARQLRVSRETVRKYLRAPALEPAYGPRAPRLSKLDPFKPFLKMRIAEAAPRRLPATVYLRELRERGYEGGISILKEWLAGQYPALPAPQIVRFETPPGRQAQADWTSIRRGRNKLSAFVGTLGFSRLSFVWFADNERFDTLIEAHERFFDALDGVPHTILYDNMKTVLIDRDAYGPGQHRFNEGFRDFARHHGFGPRMCAPYRAQTKGKVERFNRYLKESFVWPLDSRLKGQGLILDAATANAHVGAWLRDVANPRLHAETKERPIDRFAMEKALLLPRGPAWTGIAPTVPAVLHDIHVPQHDLSIYDAIGRLA